MLSAARRLEVRFATALREVVKEGYGWRELRSDLPAGITVGIVAIPLAMALAIASGVSPQYGLYTAIVGGAVIALLGGSRLSISGPTAAFVVILHPIAAQYGVGGLSLATLMAGFILLALGLGRLGRLIQYIPHPVTTGFTAGIAVVIAVLQLKDFLGLQTGALPEHFIPRLAALAEALPSARAPDLLIGGITLAILILWPRLKTNIPGHLVALAAGAAAGWLLAQWGPDYTAATIGSRFTFEIGGATGHGVPSLPPLPLLPWNLPGPNGEPIGLSFELVQALTGPALAIAILGAIESLLCAVVVDGLAGTRHDPDAELVGQGIGNLLVPFFGGIAATGAIARSATNYRAGARTPVAGVIHALLILAAVVSLAPMLAHLPMAALSALLLVVAWNMSEAKHFANIMKVAPKSDVLVLLACFGLTVLFDMVVAVSVGVVLAAFLFMGRMTEITNIRRLENDHPRISAELPEYVRVYEIAGALFFGAAEKAVSALQHINNRDEIVVLDLGGVPVMDITGLVALDSLIRRLNDRDSYVILVGVQPQPARVMEKAGMKNIDGRLAICRSLEEALRSIRAKHPLQSGDLPSSRAVQ